MPEETADLEAPLAPRPKGRKKRTNEEIFEQYRSALEAMLKRKSPWEDFMANDHQFVFSKWMYRYLRRKHDMEKMSDVVAYNALLARYSTEDEVVRGDPGWDQWIGLYLTMNYGHPETEYDVKSPEEPHRYGPSFRRLCIESGVAGALQWALHRPPAWDDEDQRRKNGRAYATPELGEPLTRDLSWHTTNNLHQPWATEVAGETWRVRLNDFPDDLMYTLTIGDDVIGKFHDWPKCWQRD